ncbi:STAS domain-containing protein [Planomonospora sp. ID91781]|uniref:STAS domain-containing protein n=1 Tax=Planomonospora sp. ID91781 TaxID=2738135 RepID=UPI0018C37B07|nr:STAS domain-containing protein [Planomonospora sp. ID91781]MBG0820157.1 STAS domain-containing protein [Planomonospora sp. ID91781]
MTRGPEAVLEVQGWRIGPTRVLRLVGELDAYTAPVVRARLDAALLDSGAPSLIVDLTPLRFMATAGISLMLKLRAEITARQGGLMLVLPAESLPRRLFEVTGLAHRFAICETLEEGVAAFRREPPDRDPGAMADGPP